MVRLRAQTELELHAKGIHEPVARAAVKRAWGSAMKWAQPLSAEIRPQAAYELFVKFCAEAEQWCVDTARQAAR